MSSVQAAHAHPDDSTTSHHDLFHLLGRAHWLEHSDSDDGTNRGCRSATTDGKGNFIFSNVPFNP
jgi:hypothetical protein